MNGRLARERLVRDPVSLRINALTRIFANELQVANVVVNSVDPGWMQTPSADATRSVEEGVETPIWLAPLPEGGP